MYYSVKLFHLFIGITVFIKFKLLKIIYYVLECIIVVVSNHIIAKKASDGFIIYTNRE